MVVVLFLAEWSRVDAGTDDVVAIRRRSEAVSDTQRDLCLGIALSDHLIFLQSSLLGELVHGKQTDFFHDILRHLNV